jgi:hypothetical protein
VEASRARAYCARTVPVPRVPRSARHAQSAIRLNLSWTLSLTSLGPSRAPREFKPSAAARGVRFRFPRLRQTGFLLRSPDPAAGSVQMKSGKRTGMRSAYSRLLLIGGLVTVFLGILHLHVLHQHTLSSQVNLICYQLHQKNEVDGCHNLNLCVFQVVERLGGRLNELLAKRHSKNATIFRFYAFARMQQVTSA